ncbi:hypothetical protein DASC09_014490 [Saccharomycopsis crataegensis]|uniref:Ubiquitin-like domain-containing protein n=1 Tax=Saccharomycopsis crataegensis TaxID=43959 RepID=A0AAV5QIA5_9ASCO|nr:hypothetical protein DASC09_014490 [Saccharomycopsis crataegensis]
MSQVSVDHFLQLLSAKNTGLIFNNNYKEDPSKITEAPISFTKNIPKTTLFAVGASKPETFTLKFKSIKPPYKFSTEFTSDSTNTIYQIKEQLIAKIKTQDEKLSGLVTSQLKFMVKSKVPNDSVQLKDIDGVKNAEISFMVMVGKAPVKPEEPSTVVPITSSTSTPLNQQSAGLELTEKSWSNIYKVLAEELGEQNAQLAVEKLKKGWNSI